jgi:hypothetical protein
MDNDTLSTHLLKVFRSFVKEITTSFPEYEDAINNNYNCIIDATDFSLKDSEIMIEFMDRINLISRRIKDRDESIFLSDEILLTGVSFKDIWSSKINDKTRESIWKYFQTFCLLDVSYRANDLLKTALDSLSSGEMDTVDTDNKTLVRELKDIKELGKDIRSTKEKTSEEPTEEPTEETTEKTKDTGFNPLEDMLKGSEIGKIAEAVSNSLDMDEMLGDLNDDSDMSEVFSKLITDGGLAKIFDGINTVVNDRVDKDSVSKEDLQKEALDMCENMGSDILSQFGGMMGTPDGTDSGNPFAMFQKMAQQMGPQKREQMRTEMQGQSNPTRERLKKKIADRK